MKLSASDVERLMSEGAALVDDDVADEALRDIIQQYTREAGVRNLEREIGALCRKVARRRAAGSSRTSSWTPRPWGRSHEVDLRRRSG